MGHDALGLGWRWLLGLSSEVKARIDGYVIRNLRLPR
jgi:hypothetical protein